MNCRTSIRGLYSRGMSYMPPAVANALFIARLFIISSSYTYVADPRLETRFPASARLRSFILAVARVPSHFSISCTSSSIV